MIPTFIRSYQAAVDVEGRRIVRFAAPSADQTVDVTVANSEVGIGISDFLGAEAGQMLDVHRSGLSSVELGDTVEAGDPLTSDATGRAVKAVAAASTTVWIIGYADSAGVVGDYIDCFVAPSALHQA
ncbi:MAG: capsid cement protein [Pseudomonadota bacterium]